MLSAQIFETRPRSASRDLNEESTGCPVCGSFI